MFVILVYLFFLFFLQSTYYMEGDLGHPVFQTQFGNYELFFSIKWFFVFHPFINPAINYSSIHLHILPCLSFILIPFLSPLSRFLTSTPSHFYHSFIYSLTNSFVGSLSYQLLIFTPLLPVIFLSLPSFLFSSFLLFPFFHILIFFVSLSFSRPCFLS